MIFDTHCHLTSSRYKKILDSVINEAKAAGVSQFMVPGTDLKNSEKAVQISKNFKDIDVGVGIHPESITETSSSSTLIDEVKQIEQLITENQVKAVGEIGLDIHAPQPLLQRELFIAQCKLALIYKKSIIIHSRGTADTLLEILTTDFLNKLTVPVVFHCCEPNLDLLTFAQQHHIYIGVDGDLSYNEDKQRFIAQVPLNLLVVETDAPYLLPEPLRSQKAYPNVPKNIVLTIEKIAEVKNIEKGKLEAQLFQNSVKLFS